MSEVAQETQGVTPLPVYFSTMNTGMSAATLWPLHRLGDFARAAGMDGIDLAPTLQWMPGHTPSSVRFAVWEKGLVVGGLHAAVRSSESVSGEYRYQPSNLATKAGKLLMASPHGRLIMPTALDSAIFMDRYQMAVGERLPACFFPQKNDRLDQWQRDVANARLSLFQAKDDTAPLVGARTPDEFVDKYINQRKYDGLIADTVHHRNQQTVERVISNFRESVPVLAPYYRAVHFALNRADLGGEAHRISREDALNVVNHQEIRGETAEIMAAARDAGSIEYAVVEATIPDVIDVLKEQRPDTKPTLGEVIGFYQLAANVVRGFMGRPRPAATATI